MTLEHILMICVACLSIVAIVLSIRTDLRHPVDIKAVSWNLEPSEPGTLLLRNQGYLTARNVRIEPPLGVVTEISPPQDLKRGEASRITFADIKASTYIPPNITITWRHIWNLSSRRYETVRVPVDELREPPLDLDPQSDVYLAGEREDPRQDPDGGLAGSARSKGLEPPTF